MVRIGDNTGSFPTSPKDNFEGQKSKRTSNISYDNVGVEPLTPAMKKVVDELKNIFKLMLDKLEPKDYNPDDWKAISGRVAEAEAALKRALNEATGTERPHRGYLSLDDAMDEMGKLNTFLGQDSFCSTRDERHEGMKKLEGILDIYFIPHP